MNLKYFFTAIIFSWLLTACNFGVPASEMQPLPITYQAMGSNPHLSKTITLGNISVADKAGDFHFGEKDRYIHSDNFKEALYNSLNQAGYISTSSAVYRLDAEILAIDVPFSLMSYTSTSKIRYRLSEVKTGKVVYNETLSLSYTATMSEAMNADLRHRLAETKSVRENITHFIKVISMKVYF